jgi:hypothetical protein
LSVFSRRFKSSPSARLRNAGFIIRAYLWPSIVLMVGGIGLQCAFTYFGPIMKSSGAAQIATVVAAAVVSAILYFAGFISVSLRSLAFIRVSNGFASDWDSAMAFCKRRLGWLIGSSFLVTIGTALSTGVWMGALVGCAFLSKTGQAGVVASVVLGLGAMIGLFCSIVLSLLYWYLLQPVLACEETTFWGVLGRTFQLLFRQSGRVLGFSFIMYVVMTAISVPVNIPAMIVTVADLYIRQLNGGAASEAATPSVLVIIFAQFWESLTQLALRPILYFAYGFLYLDLRNRAEGLDLKRRLKTLKELYLPASS